MKRAITLMLLTVFLAGFWASRSSLATRLSPYEPRQRQCMLTVATASGTSVIPLAEEVDFACRPGRDGFAARKEFENFYETGAESWTVKMDFSSAEGADELRLNLYPTDPGISSSRAISQVIALRENPCLLLERGEGSWFTALGGTFIDRSAFTVEFGCDVVSRAEQP